MNAITITFLGTSDSIPTKNRNHTSIHLQYKAVNMLVDCGEGTQRQFKFANLNPCKLDFILLTHLHGDHILGLPGLLQTLHTLGFQKQLTIYGPKGTHRIIDLIKNLTPVHLDIEVHEIADKSLEFEEFTIESKPMDHTAPTNAYSFIIKDRIRLDKKKLAKLKIAPSPLLKKLQEGKDITVNDKKIKSSQVSYTEKGKKITFILDTAPNKNSLDLAKSSDLLICESTFSHADEAQAAEKKHLTSKQAALIAKKSKSKSLVLTHISQRYQANLNQILKEAQQVFKETSIAKDLQTITLKD